MANIIKKYGAYIAVLVVAGMLLPILPTAVGMIKEAKAVDSQVSEDKRIASEISNMTGAKIEDILELKKQGKTWNDILDMLKNKDSSQQEREKRNNLLTQTGLEDDYVDKLKKEGFNDEKITEAKLLVERVVFQLQEITSKASEVVQTPTVDIDKKDEDDTQSYSDLAAKIDVKTAVYLALKLENEFGSMEKVLDEYLYSLQININLNDYLTDKEAYNKQRDEKSQGIDQQKIITMAKIEEKMLKKVQEDNIKSRNDSQVEQGVTGKGTAEQEDKSPLPVIPKPDVKSVNPPSPADEVMKEINDLNPMANQEGRGQ